MKIVSKYASQKSFWIILTFCLLFFILRLPSLFEPNWYGDEGIYQSIGFSLRSGREFYTGVWDNKPPLLFVIYALASGDQFLARLFSLFFGFGAVISYFFLSKKFFINKSMSIFTAFLFVVLFGLPIIEGNIANSENFMLFPILVAANLSYPALISFDERLKKNQIWRLFFGGIILSLSFLIKIVTVFDFAAFLSIALILFFYKKRITLKIDRDIIFTFLKNISIFISGFVSPVILSIAYFYIVGTLPYYLDAAFGRNVDYVGWANHFIIPQGLLYLRMILLIIFVFSVFIKRRSFSKETIFILVWLGFSLFNVFFSFRPYTHYMLLVLPSLLLFMGLIGNGHKIFYRVKILLSSVIIVFILLSHFHYWTLSRTFFYYINYLQFVSGKINFRTYQSFFDSRNPKDYTIATYIKSHTKPHDVIFLWGNSAHIYPLSQTIPPGRYSAAYHIGTSKSNIKETEIALEKTKPRYIIITPDISHFPFNLSGYLHILTIDDAQIYERTI